MINFQTIKTGTGCRVKNKQIVDRTNHKNRIMADKKDSHASGFTIIELLIASAIFTVVMLIVTVAVIFVSQTYIRGEISSQVQDTARNILTAIANNIEFTVSSPTVIQLTSDLPNEPYTNTDEFYFCIGSNVYTYTLDRELLPNSTSLSGEYSKYALVESNESGGSCIPSTAIGGSQQGRELLSAHERLGQLAVQRLSTATYSISVTVAYGDNYVLNDNSGGSSTSLPQSLNNSCSLVAWNKAPYAYDNYNNPQCSNHHYHCVNQLFGNTFCAISALTTTVTSRINN